MHCGKSFVRHEEKETDVAMATKLLEVIVTNECDTAILVTGDTDLIPALKLVRRLLPRSAIGVMFPVFRHNIELAAEAHYSFKINQKDIQKAQFPVEIVRPDGLTLIKPRTW